MSKTQQSIPPSLKNRIHDIQPVLDLDGPFRARDVPLDRQTTHGVLLHLEREGYIEQLDRVGGGDKAHRYRWADGVKAQFRAYIETLDTLPCGCRIHVPDTRDDRDGYISCKYCGREYVETFFKAMLEDA